MFESNTDREWEKFGKQNPYFGVLADEKFQQSRLFEAAKQEFFQTGKYLLSYKDRKFKMYTMNLPRIYQSWWLFGSCPLF